MNKLNEGDLINNQGEKRIYISKPNYQDGFSRSQNDFKLFRSDQNQYQNMRQFQPKSQNIIEERKGQEDEEDYKEPKEKYADTPSHSNQQSDYEISYSPRPSDISNSDHQIEESIIKLEDLEIFETLNESHNLSKNFYKDSQMNKEMLNIFSKNEYFKYFSQINLTSPFKIDYIAKYSIDQGNKNNFIQYGKSLLDNNPRYSEKIKKCMFANYQKLNLFDPRYNISFAAKRIDEENKAYSNFECIRYIYNDGDSFYKAFIYGYLEQLILLRDTSSICSFAMDFLNKIDQNFDEKNYSYDKNISFLLLCFIYDFLENKKDIKTSLKLLLNGFNLFNYFPNALIKYMRIRIAEFIHLNESKFKMVIFREDMEKLIPNFTKNGQTGVSNIDFDSYISQRIKAPFIEPDYFTILIVSLAFDIELDIYNIEGENCSEKNSLNISTPSNTNGSKISLIYDESKCYKLALNVDIYNKFKDIFPFPLKDNTEEPRSNIKIRFPEYQNYFPIEDIPNHPEREEFKKVLEYILNKRAMNFIKCGCFNLEFFTRPINCADENHKRFIPEGVIRSILGMSISDYILDKIKCYCPICSNFSVKTVEKVLSCGCRICDDCYEIKYEAYYGQYIFNNIFEMETLKEKYPDYIFIKDNKFVCSCCGLPFDHDLFLLYKYNEQQLNYYKELSADRLENYNSQICFYCRGERNMYNQNQFVTVIEESSNCIHYLCKSCKEDIPPEKMENKICYICKSKHKFKNLQRQNNNIQGVNNNQPIPIQNQNPILNRNEAIQRSSQNQNLVQSDSQSNRGNISVPNNHQSQNQNSSLAGNVPQSQRHNHSHLSENNSSFQNNVNNQNISGISHSKTSNREKNDIRGCCIIY